MPDNRFNRFSDAELLLIMTALQSCIPFRLEEKLKEQMADKMKGEYNIEALMEEIVEEIVRKERA